MKNMPESLLVPLRNDIDLEKVVNNKLVIEMSRTAEIYMVKGAANANDKLKVWILDDPNAVKEKRTFLLIKDGQVVRGYKREELRHVASFNSYGKVRDVDSNGYDVMHLLEILRDSPSPKKPPKKS